MMQIIIVKKKNKTTKSKSFEYWTKIIGKMSDDKIAQVVVPLKYFSNFWWFLD